jgi:riboflavin kinase/FMN adenylyltransferase
MSVEVVEPCRLSDLKVSSTLIRSHLTEGRVKQANELLGRPYSIRGKVIAGEGRGNTIGYPTANVEPIDEYFIPCNGVYAVRIWLGDQCHGGVMNIGVKPTFHKDGMKQTLEAHIFDFSQNIYGDQVRIEFMDYIRPEQRFSSVQELVAQIHRDADQARALIASI